MALKPGKRFPETPECKRLISSIPADIVKVQCGALHFTATADAYRALGLWFCKFPQALLTFCLTNDIRLLYSIRIRYFVQLNRVLPEVLKWP